MNISPPPPPPSPPFPPQNNPLTPQPSGQSGGGRKAAAMTNGRRLWLTGGSDDGGESFDALTDLFLGEVARPRREREEAAPAAVMEPRPVLRLVADAAEGEAGNRGRASAPLQPPFVECLVVGNLPVLASAWASQYVREVARAAERPVAFVRVQAGYITVELVGEGAAEQPSGPAAGDLDSALRQAGMITNRWVVRVDTADEADVAGREGVRLVTLLTGTDEAARVNAYGTLKMLGESLGDESGAMVRVAVMSAPEEQAEAAGRTIVETVRKHLNREVQHAACSSKIKSSRPARLVFNGRLDGPASLVMSKIADVAGATGVPPLGGTAAPKGVVATGAEVEPVVEVAVEEPSAPPTPVHAPTPMLEPEARAEAEIAEVEPAVAVVEEDAVEIPAAAAIDVGAEVEPVMAAEVVVSAAPAETVRRVDDVALWSAAGAEPKSRMAADPGDLARFVAGAERVSVSCPYAEQVQVAVDGEGRLHLLARSGGPEDDERALAGLMVASAWAEAHAGLLGAALPRMRTGAGPAVMHVFTGTPKRSRRLLETNLRVHVLGAAGGEWFSAELN